MMSFLEINNLVQEIMNKFFTSTLAAIRKAATAINCKFFCVTNPVPAVVELIDC
jgi:hypothetical protein